MIMILHLKYFVSYLMLLCYLFWFKIMDSDNIILRTMYYAALDDCIKGRTNWVSNIKHLFNECEFAKAPRENPPNGENPRKRERSPRENSPNFGFFVFSH